MATLPLPHPTSAANRHVEHTALWVLQWALSGVLLAVGIAKFALSPSTLHSVMPWSAAVPVWFVRVIAIAEITGAVGLVVPAWLKVVPELTPFAACGVAAMQWLALAFHLGRQEWFMSPVNLAIGLAAGLVAWGRFRHLPIRAESSVANDRSDRSGHPPPRRA